MFDKIWELFTSDEKLDRLCTRGAVLGFVFIVFFISYYMTKALLIALGLLALVAVIIFTIINTAERRAEAEWQRLLNEEDDGETGYIQVRPEEMNGVPPWEKPTKD